MKSVSQKKDALNSGLLLSIGAIFIVFYVIIFTVSPLNGEDFALTRGFHGSEILTRLAWVVQRSHQQIVAWNARLGEQLAIFWLSMPKFFFTSFALFCYLAFCFLTASIFSANRRLDKTLIAIMLISILWPRLELFFWGTANAGYLQPLVIVLICLYAYSAKERVAHLLRSSYFYLVISVAGFLAGLSFENIPLVVVIYSLLALLLYGRSSVSYKTIAPIISVIIGWLLLITAPSTVHRINYYKGVFGSPDYSYQYIIHRLMDVIEVFVYSSGALVPAVIMAGFYLFWKACDKNRLILNIAAIGMVVLSVVPAPYTEPRAFSLAWALMIGICVNAIYELAITLSYKWIISLLAVIGLYFTIKTAYLYYDFSDYLSERHYYIKKMASTLSCDTGIVVNVSGKFYPERYINNRDVWYRKATKQLEKYYGCRIFINP